jgi:hypothetical protein
MANAMKDDAFSFDSALEWHLAGTSEKVKVLLKRLAFELQVGAHKFAAEERFYHPKPPFLLIQAKGSGGGDIGLIEVDELPGTRVRMRVPAGRGDPTSSWSADPEGELFSAYLGAALGELRRSGFLANSSRFESHEVLQTARRELDAAADSTSFANIGNSCRTALKALANETWREYMVPSGQPPKAGDADAKLKQVLNHYFAGRGERYRSGLAKVVDGVWDMSQPLTHRGQTASREEAEAALALVAALFEAFSFIIPP